MNNINAFFSAAFPWIMIGLLLAGYFAYTAKNQKDGDVRLNHGMEGMSLGLCLGFAIGYAINNLTVGMMMGMAGGLIIGSMFEKKGQE